MQLQFYLRFDTVYVNGLKCHVGTLQQDYNVNSYLFTRYLSKYLYYTIIKTI
eukprot:UN00567